MNAVFQRISPPNSVAKIRTQLFVVQDRNDSRVPMSEAEQIVKAVRGNGEPVWYVLFNDEDHCFRKKVNNDYFNAATMLFWQYYLLGHTKD
jgi:dipeptidyl aminopeptidase/acylaminoacyl peptidase